MYEVGEFVVYGNDGVCEIEEISKMQIPGTTNSKNYYTLKPINNNTKVFTPVDTKIFMRPVVTSKEIQNIVEQIPSVSKSKYDNKNIRLLQEYYKKLLNTHECIDLLTIIASVNNKRNELANTQKKLGQIEEKYFKIAKDLIEDEFSVVLGISKEDAQIYIEDRMNV